MANRRIVIRLLSGVRAIMGEGQDVTPAVLAFGNWQEARLERVEKTYVLYREIAKEAAHDDGA